MTKFCFLLVLLLVLLAAAAAGASSPKSSFNDELVAAMDETAFCDSKLVPLRDAVTRAMEEGAKATPPQTARTILFHEHILYCGRARRNQIWALAAQLCAADMGLYVQCNTSNVIDGKDGARLIPFTTELRDPAAAAADDSCNCGAPPPAETEPVAPKIQKGAAVSAGDEDWEDEDAPPIRSAEIRRKKRVAS